MKYLKLLFLATAIVTMIQCDVDTEIEQQTESDFIHSIPNSQTREFTGKIKRIRIKKKRVGSGYKIVGKASGTNGIHHYAAVIEEREGIIPVPENFDWMPNGELDEEGNRAFLFNELSFEGENPDGKPLPFLITPMDIDNNPVGETEKVWLTVQDNDGVYVSKVQVKETNNPNKFKGRINFIGVNVLEIGSVFMQISTLDGTQSIPVEMGEVDIENNTPTISYTNFEWQYADLSNDDELNIVPMGEVNTTISIYSTTGDLIDDLSFIGTVMPKMEMEGITVGNVTIKPRNNSDFFKLKVPVSGTNRDEVASVDVVFSDYSGPEPFPSEVTMTQTGENTYVDFYTFNELEFDDPTSVSGETYVVIVDLKDNEGNAIGATEVSVTVE